MPVLPILGIGLAAAGTAVSAIGQASAGANAQSAANLNAQEAVNSANNTLESGKIAESQQRYQDRLVLAQQRASYGASGVTLEGSPMDVMTESARQAELAALETRRNYRLQAQQILEGAQSDVISGQNAKTASEFGVASTLLTGGSRVAQGVVGLQRFKKIVPGVQPNSAGGTDQPTGSVYG